MFGAGADGAVFRDTYKTAHEILVKFPQRINAETFMRAFQNIHF